MRGWSSGGGIYEDFLRLATATRGRRDPTRLNRLVNALVAKGDHVRSGSGMNGLEECVAFKEMSRAVASWTTHENVQASTFFSFSCCERFANNSLQTVEASKMLGLPLTGDARVMQTVEMSRRYFGIIMAGGY
jgi:nuclear pore complex protein Nup98-Nup96